MVHVLASVVMMMFPAVVFVVFPEDHFLAAWRVLGHVDVRVSEVVVVAPGGLVPLGVMERTFFVLDRVSGRRGRERSVTLVWAVDVVLLSQLPRQRVVMRESRRVHRVVLRRSVLENKEPC